MRKTCVLLSLSVLSAVLVNCGGDNAPSHSAAADSGGAGGSSTTNGSGGSGGTAQATGVGGTSGANASMAGTAGADDGDCETPPAAPDLTGWASEAGGTIGGGDAEPVVVTTLGELISAAAGPQPRVIHVNGSLSGSFSIGSNKTIIGVCGAEFLGSITITGQQNIIMRNLKVVGNNCSDSPNDCSSGTDAIGVRSSHHLWFDHMDISDGSDGNLDMTHNTDYVTISWTKFWYSTARSDPDAGSSGHRFSNLIGASDTDVGDYRITFHHNWWAQNVNQRMPRSRFGDIHVFNNLFTAEGNSYCTNAGISSHLLVENNIYRGVNNPLSPDGNGDMRAEGNVFDDTEGNESDNGGVGFDPPYAYHLDATKGLDDRLEDEVGPHD